MTDGVRGTVEVTSAGDIALEWPPRDLQSQAGTSWQRQQQVQRPWGRGWGRVWSRRAQCGGGDEGPCAPAYLCGICFPGQKMPCVCFLSKPL